MKTTTIETVRDGDLDITRFAVAQMAALEIFERVESSFQEKLEADLEGNLQGNRQQRKEATEALALHIKRCKQSFKSFKKNNKVLVDSVTKFASAKEVQKIVKELVKEIDKGIKEERDKVL